MIDRIHSCIYTTVCIREESTVLTRCKFSSKNNSRKSSKKWTLMLALIETEGGFPKER